MHHKISADTLLDGGIIEISFDNGFKWFNIFRLDSICATCSNYGYNFDTIASAKTVGFTGHMNAWEGFPFSFNLTNYSIPFPDTILLKFTFKSDAFNNSTGGWMIDAIWLGSFTVGIDKFKILNGALDISPMPLEVNSIIKSNLNIKGSKINLYDLTGKIIFTDKIETVPYRSQTSEFTQRYILSDT